MGRWDGNYTLYTSQLENNIINFDHWIANNDERLFDVLTTRNSTSNAFTYITTYSTHVFIKGRKEMYYFTTHSTHFIYGYMASNIW